MSKIYIRTSYRYLNDKFQEAVKSDFDSIITQRLAFFICFNLVIFILYFVFWMPLIESLTKDVKKKIFYLR